MDCTQTEWLSDEEYGKKFNKKVMQQRVPLFGSIDLTHRCNLKCVHCYLGDREDIAKNGRPELSTAQWISIIDEITEAGCLYFLITGGEPLLRKDFSQIYRHAKEKGLLVTVFTNGTLITDPILELFNSLPPQTIEISLYGATAATYEKITGLKGSFRRCLSGIEQLLDHNINVKLKTILMTFNRHEFYDIENMAKAYGVNFRFDAAIFPRANRDITPLSLRVTPEEAVEKELSSSERLRDLIKFYDRQKAIALPDRLYICGAGTSYFHSDPYGTLRPCLMVTSLNYKIVNGSFTEGWRHTMPRIREKKPGVQYSCSKCTKMPLCGFCPAFFELENGSENLRSDYLCHLGQLRYQAIKI